VVGSHVGVSLAADGPSQMALPDTAFARAFTEVADERGGPMMYVLTPADAYAAYALTGAMARHPGACYMRTMRPDVPFLYDDETSFELGGLQVPARGKDLLVAATGYMVHEVLGALDTFRERDLEPTVVDLYSLPFDAEALIGLARENGGRVLTVEDNYGGGMGSAVAEVLAREGGDFQVERMVVSRIPKSGRTPDDVLRYLGLAAKDIVARGEGLCAKTPG
jgi:transketolase